MKKTVLIILILTTLFAGCRHSESERKVRWMLDYPENAEITTEGLRRAILKKWPVGSSGAAISGGLWGVEVCKNKPESILDKKEFTCQIEFETGTIISRKKSFNLKFFLDEAYNVKSVEVE